MNSHKKAPSISPVFLGMPVAPTPGKPSNSTQKATTEFVNDKIDELIEDVLEDMQDEITNRASIAQLKILSK